MAFLILFSLGFVAIGAMILLQALNVFDFFGKALVPNVVIGVAGAVFLGAGLLMLWRALGSPGKTRAPVGALLLRSDEDSGGIVKIWVFNAFYLGIIGVCDYAFLFAPGPGAGFVGFIVLGLFSVFGIVYFFVAVRKSLEWFKYGVVELRLAAPLTTGRPMSAFLALPPALTPTTRIAATLSCVRVLRRQDRGGDSDSVSETVAWSESRHFSIASGGAIGHAEMRFAIPHDMPGTDLPENGLPEPNRTYHRWELKVGANVAGINLDRTFKLNVEPGKPVPFEFPSTDPESVRSANSQVVPARPTLEEALAALRTSSKAAGNSPDAMASRPATVSPPPSTTSSMNSATTPWTAPRSAVANRMAQTNSSTDLPQGMQRATRMIFGVLGVALTLWWFGALDWWRILAGTGNALPAVAVATASAGPFDMSPDQFQQVLRPFASDVKVERHGEDIHVRIGKLRLVKVNGSEAVQYQNVGAYVFHKPAQGPFREIGKWQDGELRGAIDPGRSEETLGPVEFIVRNVAATCASGECWLKLYATAPVGPHSFRMENTAPVPFLFSQTSEIAAVPVAPKYWDTYHGRAQRLLNQGKYPEAQQAFDEALAFAQRQHGVDSAIYAYILMGYADLYRRQGQSAEAHKRLVEAADILDALDDATIIAQVGPDWGGASPIQELAPREVGQGYMAQGKFAEAEKYHERALAVTGRLGARLNVYTIALKRADNLFGVGQARCHLGQIESAAKVLAMSHDAASQARKSMEDRWAQLFKQVPPDQAHVHRPNYEAEKRSHEARMAKINAYEAAVKQGSCASLRR